MQRANNDLVTKQETKNNEKWRITEEIEYYKEELHNINDELLKIDSHYIMAQQEQRKLEIEIQESEVQYAKLKLA